MYSDVSTVTGRNCGQTAVFREAVVFCFTKSVINSRKSKVVTSPYSAS